VEGDGFFPFFFSFPLFQEDPFLLSSSKNAFIIHTGSKLKPVFPFSPIEREPFLEITPFSSIEMEEGLLFLFHREVRVRVFFPPRDGLMREGRKR